MVLAKKGYALIPLERSTYRLLANIFVTKRDPQLTDYLEYVVFCAVARRVFAACNLCFVANKRPLRTKIVKTDETRPRKKLNRKYNIGQENVFLEPVFVADFFVSQ